MKRKFGSSSLAKLQRSPSVPKKGVDSRASLQASQLVKPSPRKVEQTLVAPSYNIDIAQYVKLFAHVIRTIQTTMPVIMQTYWENNAQLTNESMLSALDMKPSIPRLNLNELLFPAFNTLVPSMYENLLPHLGRVKISNSDIEVVVATFHSMLSFAFKTQIFDRVLWKKIANNSFSLIIQGGDSARHSQGSYNDDRIADGLILP